MKRILSIDGGGIKGVFPASFLATLEDSLGGPVANYFDLIVGTSTGGIIALGLGLGLGARQVLGFYLNQGGRIFGGNRIYRYLRRLGVSKYSPDPLRKALEEVFGNRRLGESKSRLVVPSFNLDSGEVHLWKTSHHPHLERDFRASVVDVALSTASAPTYFPTHRGAAGTPLLDGGVWANNPVAVAMVECVGVLGWHPRDLRVLSLGCTTTPLAVNWGRTHALGAMYWGSKIADVFMTAQSSSALGMAQHLIEDRANLVRISPTVGKRFGIDTVKEIPSLMGLGDSEARKALPSLRSTFFAGPPAEPFEPCHELGASTGMSALGGA
jgi:patatin-like phospholipase/acyl hydrolase